MTDEEFDKWKESISKGNKGKQRTDKHKANYSKVAKQRIWLIHKSGKLSHTINKNDPRFDDPDWQKGKIFKDNF